MENPALKMWPPMEEVTAGFLSRMIQKTQERIENHFFEARKHVLEYDDVLNAQREHIYALRRAILLGEENPREDIKGFIRDLIPEMVENAWMLDENDARHYDYGVLYEDLNEVLPLVDYATISDLEKYQPGPQLVQFIQEKADEAYDAKMAEAGENMPELEKFVMLRAVNDKWMEHLQTIEYIREGISLRGYGQVDPLVAYKRETYDTFQTTLKGIRDQAARMIFHLRVQRQEDVQLDMDMAELAAPMMVNMDDLPPEAQEQQSSPTKPAQTSGGNPVDLSKIDWKRVGRNDACPCGSGKKFKSCHYPKLREDGVI
ncbi:MAG TPA: SEC-C metal-binding domain-containing protein, partial [Fimbriimonas sp.]|nr:SEC-C metal-binding domain-containing protein [Fimbriimonas sp.]